MAALIFENIKIVPKGRPRFFRGHAVTPATTREFEKQVRDMALAQIKDGGDEVHFFGPIECTIYLYFKKPKTNKSDWCNNKKDVDNCAKAILDALNGILYEDDRQIVKLTVTKKWTHLKEFFTVEIRDADSWRNT
jgi:Holliday junction resolvase RusA-like endonuclease